DVTTIQGVEISNPDKVLFPDDKITKAEFVQYCAEVAAAMLPFARGHPVAMLRFPNGIHGQRFFQKQAPDYFPDFIRRVEIPKAKGTTNYRVCDTAEAIVYIASQACIEFHLLPTLADRLGYTDRMVFDLDPSIDDSGLGPQSHTLRTVRERLEGRDPWSDMRRHAKSLDRARKALDRLTASLSDGLETGNFAKAKPQEE